MLLTILDIALPYIGKIALSGFVLVAFELCFLSVFAFEFVNGFHDTANAVATFIYTKHYDLIRQLFGPAFSTFSAYL